ncbi:MAG: ATP-binding domain-containing protein, partial [Cyanothece sp. SIO1E1]|nr:ATP-binding domain-containing protein [Cyanothece sp. SIO1E1]
GQEVTFSTKEYKSVSLGYAMTVHKSQGMTVDNAYIMTSGNWDKHLAYVAGSRARDATRMYASGNVAKRETVKAKVAEKMSRDNQKQLARDKIQQQERENALRVGQER